MGPKCMYGIDAPPFLNLTQARYALVYIPPRYTCSWESTVCGLRLKPASLLPDVLQHLRDVDAYVQAFPGMRARDGRERLGCEFPAR